MENLEQIIKKIIEMMGFDDFSVNYDSESGNFSLFISDGVVSEKNLPLLVSSFNCVLKLAANKNGEYSAPAFLVDVNNYRKKREGLIIDLARAAVRKSLAENKEVFLPAMNAYERRLIHVELARHPDVKTESVGEGKERHIIIKPIAN